MGVILKVLHVQSQRGTEALLHSYQMNIHENVL